MLGSRGDKSLSLPLNMNTEMVPNTAARGMLMSSCWFIKSQDSYLCNKYFYVIVWYHLQSYTVKAIENHYAIETKYCSFVLRMWCGSSSIKRRLFPDKMVADDRYYSVIPYTSIQLSVQSEK